MAVGSPIEARLLVVDDDEANRESLSRRLRRQGMTVDLAVDGTDALLQINGTTYDLILLDVMMPGLSGLDVLERIRQTQTPIELPIIMATANDAPNDIAQAFALGANDYVTKPIDFTVTLARIKTQLEMARATRQAFQLQSDLSLRNAELENAVAALRFSAERTRRDLELAARIQGTFLPRNLPVDTRYSADWRYLPCDELAGDSLNVCPLGPDHVAFYVLDVTGHGVASSLTAVTAARMMAPAGDPASILTGPDGPIAPSAVMNELSIRFPFDTVTGQFITCFYALLDLRSGRLDYVSAGHPDAVLVPRGSPSRLLAGTGLPVGLGETYEQQCVTLNAGDRVWLYSDGIIEAARPDGTLFSTDRLVDLLSRLRSEDSSAATDQLIGAISAWCETSDFADDISLLVVTR